MAASKRHFCEHAESGGVRLGRGSARLPHPLGGLAVTPDPLLVRPMRSRWCCCFEAAVLVLAVAACIGPAAANTFDPAQVIQALQRQMMAAEAADSAVIPGVRVEEAVLDLGLVEVMEKAGGRLRVPGADFGAEKNEAVKPPLRRRMLVDLARIGDARPAQPDAVAAQAAGSGAMGLASVLADLRSATRST